MKHEFEILDSYCDDEDKGDEVEFNRLRFVIGHSPDWVCVEIKGEEFPDNAKFAVTLKELRGLSRWCDSAIAILEGR